MPNDGRAAAEALFKQPETPQELSPDQIRHLYSLRERIEAERKRRAERAEHLERVKADADKVRRENERFSGMMANTWHLLEPGAKYMPNWHIDAIGEHLEAVNRKQIQRLQINMPPGMMKSTTVSVVFPAWEWGPKKMPWLRYFTTSYEASYARRDSRKHRDLIETEWYRRLYPEIVLEKRAEEAFTNTFKGYRLAVPFERLTAGRGNRFIVDDPHSLDGAESDTERDKAIRRFRESGSSRLNDQANDCIIVVMQRLHPDDLCGMIEDSGLPYVKLVLPMEYVRSLSVKTPWFEDPRTEETGDDALLHPRWMAREKVEEKRIEVQEHGYQTQYQQQPRSRAGSSYFHDEHLLVKSPLDPNNPSPDYPKAGFRLDPIAWPMGKLEAVFAIVDSATKLGIKNDGTGVGYFGLQLYPKPQGYVLDWDIQQVEASLLEVWLPNVHKRGEELARELKVRNGFVGCWIEDKDSGQVLLQQAKRKGWTWAQPLPSDFTALGKEGRALSVSGYASQGKMKMTAPAWEKTTVYKGKLKNHFKYQVTSFRMGKGTPDDADELFDIWCYSLSSAFGDVKGV